MILDLSDGPGSDPYRCQCPKGFTGELCEIAKIKIGELLNPAVSRLREILKQMMVNLL